LSSSFRAVPPATKALADSGGLVGWKRTDIALKAVPVIAACEPHPERLRGYRRVTEMGSQRMIFLMSTQAQRHPLRAEDLYTLPDDGRRYELVAGQLLSEPPVQARHGKVVVRIAALLDNFVRPRRLGTLYAGDTGFILARSPDTVRAPDVAFVASAREDMLEDEDRFLPGAPDLAIEVLSPSDRPGELEAKVAAYLTAGKRLVWIVDPARGRVTEHRSLLGARTFSADDDLKAEDLLPGFGVKVSALF